MKRSLKRKPRFGARNLLVEILIFSALSISLVWTLFPLYWAFSTAFKPEMSIFSIPPEFLPKTLVCDNFVNLFMKYPFARYFVNSFIVTSGALSISIPLGSIAAYSFSRYKFPASKYLLSIIIISRMIPPVAYIIPLYILVWSFGLLDTHLGVILAHCSILLPFIIWIMKGFFDELPRVFEEAAMIDGCSRWGALKMALRLSLPGLGVATIFGFVESWNEFMFALTITRSISSVTIPVGLAMLLQRPWKIPWGEIMAGSLLFTLPIFTLGYIIQKYIARVFVLGGYRG